MGWIKSLFFKSERVKRVAERLDPVHIPGERKTRKCGLCGGNIMPDHKMTKQNGSYFHKVCWKAGLKGTNI
jgi:hypothetical protein